MNILVIFTDQQRFDAMGAYGNNVIKTPNMDKLAEEGVLFKNAVTPAPMCTPARTSFLSGKTASKIGCLGNNHASNINVNETLMNKLKEKGFFTQAIGKMHFTNKAYEESYGFDNMILSEEMRGVRFAKSYDDIVYDDYDNFLKEKNLWGWEKPTEIGYNEIKPLINPLKKEHHVTQWCGDQAVSWLRDKRPKDKPFFLWVSFVKPHVPYDCPSHLTELYNIENMPKPFISNEDGVKESRVLQNHIVANEFDLYSEKARNMSLAAYYANITFIDEQIGRILNEIKEQGIEDDTLILFTADHGDMMGDHGLWYKGYGFEGSMHIPMLLKYNGFTKAGTKCEEIVNLLDFYATIAELIGFEKSEDMPGKNLLDLSNGKIKNDFTVSEMYNSPNYVVHTRTKEWKYLYFEQGGYELLYNLKEDPYELKILSIDPEYSSIKTKLKKQTEEWIKKYGDLKNLDKNGQLRVSPEPEILKYNISPRPFSRYPWDSRIPPAYIDKNTYFWDTVDGDWSKVLKIIKNPK